ncbi:hypothetical protein BC937DRAFT_91943 [Endogone sp. FLAS-F59071]|nr:hypothetical protein BC937DRAFT_91943 [Endogone sp. FLAS-F59071]|eukprot:RUS21651.1 hypothetical protein BC937DRAFT_91943 [Endogone sp. FLAS-F59071]
MASLARVLSRPRPILSKIIPRATYITATSDYIPGKRGYAPGFEPPPQKSKPKDPSTGNTQELLSKPDATISNTVTAKTVVTAAATAPKISGNDVMRRFREEMHQRRFNYVQELLQKQEKRKIVSERKQKEATLKMQKQRAIDAEAKEKAILHEASVLLNLGLGKVETAAETLAEAEIMVATAKAKDETKNETESEVIMTQLRPSVLRSREQAKSDERLSLLMRLYHSSKDFVTYENLDAKLDEFIAAPNVSYSPTLEELQADVGYKERKIVKMRMEKLQEALEGMMGDNLAAEGVKEWVRNQEVDTDTVPMTAQETVQEPAEPVKEADNLCMVCSVSLWDSSCAALTESSEGSSAGSSYLTQTFSSWLPLRVDSNKRETKDVELC